MELEVLRALVELEDENLDRTVTHWSASQVSRRISQNCRNVGTALENLCQKRLVILWGEKAPRVYRVSVSGRLAVEESAPKPCTTTLVFDWSDLRDEFAATEAQVREFFEEAEADLQEKLDAEFRTLAREWFRENHVVSQARHSPLQEAQ